MLLHMPELRFSMLLFVHGFAAVALGTIAIGCGTGSGTAAELTPDEAPLEEDAGLSSSIPVQVPEGAAPQEQASGAGDEMPMADVAQGSEQGAPSDAPSAAEEGGVALPPVDDFAAPGPFAVAIEEIDAACTLWRPESLGEGGTTHPVILWGNGTGTPTVRVYAGFFDHWASHGFIVAAAHTATSGSGQEMLACLDWLEAENARVDSPYAGHVASDVLGSSGHSQGGGGALMVGRDPRVRATVPLQAWTLASEAGVETQQAGPMFLVSGDLDLIAPPEVNQRPVYEGSNVPVFWGTIAGGDHVSIALGAVEAYLAPTVAWFRLHLAGDERARSMFYGEDCALCSDSEWTVERRGIQ